MDQVTADYTYRLDAVRSICEPVDWQGGECLEVLGIWAQQHAINVWTDYFFEPVSLIIIGGILVIIFLLFTPSSILARIVVKEN